MTDASQTATFTAPDISCGHCEMTVKSAVGKLNGVNMVDASSETQQVTVEFDPTQVTTDQIQSTLAKAGYPALAR